MEWTADKDSFKWLMNSEGCWLMIRHPDRKEVQDFIQSLEKPQTIEIKPLRKKRSLDANSYLWVICDKIAKAIKSTKEDVYRIAIRDVGEWEDKPILTEDVEKHIKMWGMIGEGWFSEERRDSKLPGHKVVRDYYGSHIYDTVSMSRLIDYIVEQAKEMDIPTDTPDEIARIKAAWGK
jgi:hypothetical protein